MVTGRRGLPRAWVLATTLALFGARAMAQGPTIDTPDNPSPGSGGTLFGKSPGAGGSRPSQDSGTLLGGRAGPTMPKGVPTSISSPGMMANTNGAGRQGVARTVDQPPAAIPASGPLAVPPTQEDPGPPGGLTLDEAINRVVRENLDLRSKFFEIPQAKADVLTASLRANPVFYADGQLVPYGQYTRQRPGGQTQYDVNISYPLDISGKRKRRTESAVRATQVTEAQYQDAVRQTIDNLYTGYVDVLQARRTIAFSKAGLEGLRNALAATEGLLRQGIKKPADVQRIRIQVKIGEQQVIESEEAYRKAKQALATQLNLAPGAAESVELNGTLNFPGVQIPPIQEMFNIAWNNRPDIAAYRLGVERARSDVKLQYANRLQDVYVLYQPYTLQDNTPFGLKSPTSWALGVTIPLPIYNRNQGNIERSKLNVRQTQVELSSVERQALQEVQVAEREYLAARASVDRYQAEILPDATSLLQEAQRLFPAEIDILDYLAALRDYNEAARSFLDSQVRLRRAMLNINTVVGQRILP